mgnify:CR=1 FL=1
MHPYAPRRPANPNPNPNPKPSPSPSPNPSPNPNPYPGPQPKSGSNPNATPKPHTHPDAVYYDDLCRAGPAFIDLRNSLRSLGLGALRVTPTGLKEMFSSRLGTATVSIAVVSDRYKQNDDTVT